MKKGERLLPKNTEATVKHDKKINVWGCFAAHGVGLIHRIRGIMVKEIYEEILDNVACPSIDILFPLQDFIFQQDNDPKHTSYLIQDWFEDHGIEPMWWPSQSPDLNPIENLWSILDHRLQNRRVNSEEELFECLRAEWNNLPRSLLEELCRTDAAW